MSTQISARRARYPEYIGNLVGAPLALLTPISPIFVISRLENASLPGILGLVLLFGAMAVTAGGGFVIGWLAKRLAEKLLLDAISPVAAHFFRSETLVSGISASWRSMRAQIAALFNR